MAQKISLRDYQRELAERLRLADSARSPSKLGLEIGTESWLVDRIVTLTLEMATRAGWRSPTRNITAGRWPTAPP